MASMIFTRVGEGEIVVDDIIQVIHPPGNSADLSFTIDGDDIASARTIGELLLADLPGAKLEIRERLSKVSVVGVGMRTHTGVASRMFEALHQASVNIENISTSEIVISCVINQDDGDTALRAVHAAFRLGEAPSNDAAAIPGAS